MYYNYDRPKQMYKVLYTFARMYGYEISYECKMVCLYEIKPITQKRTLRVMATPTINGLTYLINWMIAQ